MKLSRRGAMAIIAHEGIVLTRYKDSVGVWSLGVGHTKAAGFPYPENFRGKLTLSAAFDLFMIDVTKYEAAVNAAVKVPLNQHEFDALVSWHYNTGAVAKASLIRKLNAGDKTGAAKGLLDWKRPPGIMDRRRAEFRMFKRGIYPLPTANVYPATPEGKVLWGKAERVNLENALAEPEAFSGGGGGGTTTKLIPVEELGPTITVSVGTGGVGGPPEPVPVVPASPEPPAPVPLPVPSVGFWARFFRALWAGVHAK